MIFPDLFVKYINFIELSKCLCSGTDIAYKNITSFYDTFLKRKGVPIFGKWNPEGAIAEPEDIVPGVSFTLKDVGGRHIGFIYKNSPNAVKEVHRLNKKYISRVSYSPDDFQLVLIGDKGNDYDSDSRLLELNASDIDHWNPQCVIYFPTWADEKGCLVAKRIKTNREKAEESIRNDNKLTKEEKNKEIEKLKDYLVIWARYARKLLSDEHERFCSIEDGKLLWKRKQWELAYWCKHVGEKCKLYEMDNISWEPFNNMFHKKNKNGEFVPISARDLTKSYSEYNSKHKEDKLPDTLKPLLE